MKLACFTLFRNEAAILDPFLDQLQAFFDHCVLLDHGSTDGGADKVRARGDGRFELLRLQAAGYPQSEVATEMARRIQGTHAPDFLFLLDCDEFLPFADRAALERAILPHRDAAALGMDWQNVVPATLDGGNIFAQPMLRTDRPTRTRKVILGAALATRQGWHVAQGYHEILDERGGLIEPVNLAEKLLHVPVQSRLQFRFKVAAGSRRIRSAPHLRARELGAHWIQLDERVRSGALDDDAIRALALNYPDPLEVAQDVRPLDFHFPYLRTPSAESLATIAGQVEGLLDVLDSAASGEDTRAFSIMAEDGTVIAASPGATVPAHAEAPGAAAPDALFGGSFGEHYAALVEPLFKLPTKLPQTAWAGHIPFLFALFRQLRPRTYVDLGVHRGASLIAAATAARTYGVDARCVGVDTWQGDEHAGHYEGDEIYRWLSDYTKPLFPFVELKRCLFSEARRHFRAGSVDLLHIDGLHTYDAVKEDFTTWFGAMAPDGVILFHDICVHDRGFGVHMLWDELKRHFRTMEFHHSFGLGVLFLDPSAPRFAPFRALMADAAMQRTYRSLVSDIAATLGERMMAPALEDELHREREAHGEALAAIRAEKDRIAERVHLLEDQLRQKDAHIHALQTSTSWRLTAPLRRVRGD